MECDYDPIFPVCGPNWKTYRSMCHALYCGDLRIEDVKEGSCETMVSKNNCRDLELVSSLARVHNSGSLFQSHFSYLFLAWDLAAVPIIGVSFLATCPQVES